MKYAHYDEKQNLIGWYDDKINKKIPKPNIQISFTDWEDALKCNANYVDLVNKKVINKDTRTTKEKLKDLKKEKLNSFYASHNYKIFIDDYEFSCKREDILKYKEAADAIKFYSDIELEVQENVKLNLLNGWFEFTLESTYAYISKLAKIGYDNYWIEKQYEEEINNCSTLTMLKNIPDSVEEYKQYLNEKLEGEL